MLAVLIGLVALSGCRWLPMRMVRVPARTLATEELEVAREAADRGDRRVAVESFERACVADPSWTEAWNSRIEYLFVRSPATSRTVQEARSALAAELDAWVERDESARPVLLRSSLLPVPDRLSDWNEAWRREPAFPDLMDPWALGLRRRSDWLTYERFLLGRAPLADPTDQARVDRRRRLVQLELGRFSDVSRELEGAIADPLIEALIAYARRDRDAAMQALARIDAPDVEESLLRIVLDFDADARQVRDSIERARNRWGENPELKLLEILNRLRGGDRTAEEELWSISFRLVLPRFQVLAVTEWVRARRLTAGGRLAQDFDRVVQILELGLAAATDRGQSETIQAMAATWGAMSVLQKALESETKGLAAPAVSGRTDAARVDAGERSTLIAILERVSSQPLDVRQAVGAVWKILAEPGVPRCAELSQLSEPGRSIVLTGLLASSRPDVRVRVLRLIRETSAVSFSRLPPALARDPDERVRGMWVTVAAADGSDSARRAVVAARSDPSAYVRELAERFSGEGK